MFEKFKTIFKGKEAPKGKTEAKADAKASKSTEKARTPDKAKPTEAKAAPAKAAPKKPQTPEEMCGIMPKMGKDEVRERLAFLYKRYNRATSSLDAGLRAEAEEMLDAVVMVREKVFGAI